MNTRRLMCTLVMVASTSCATSTVLPAATYRDDLQAGVVADDPKDADLVVLHQGLRYVIVNPPARAGLGEFHRHRVVKVLTEAGFAAASAHVWVPNKGTLAHFQARTIAPDGTVYEVDPDTVVADVTTSGEDSAGSRSFQFPRVTVGSILELTTTVTVPYAQWFLIEGVAEAHPVRHYEVEIWLDRFVVPDVFVNNASPALDYNKSVPGGMQRIAFSLDNIAATSSQSWQPPWRALSPWWAYRAIEWVFPNQRALAASSWGRALSGSVSERLVDLEGLDGLGRLRGHEHCVGDRACVATAALAQLRSDIPFVRFDDFYDCRPLDEVKNAGGANNHEKTLALWKLLNDAGVPAQLAVSTHDVQVDAAETFPSPVWFDHSLVYLPPSSTVPAVWIDPSCEHCAVGEVPSWVMGKRAVVLSTADGERGPEVRASPFHDVTGVPARPSRRARTATMTVMADGDVHVVEDEVRDGVAAVDVIVAEADMTDDAIKKSMLSALRERSRSVTLQRGPRWSCDRAVGRCTRRIEYTLPGLATVVGADQHIMVPLFALNSLVENRLLDLRADERRHDILFDVDDVHEETVTVVPPTGYVAAVEHKGSPPKKVAGLQVDVDVDASDAGVRITRRYEVSRGRHPRAHWSALQEVLSSSRAAKELNVRLERAPVTAPAP